MGNEQVIRNMLDNRDVKYGQSWLVTGKLMPLLKLDRIINQGLFFAWIMILNKLMRAMTTPDDIDHWKDIAGYAILVADHLGGTNEQKPE